MVKCALRLGLACCAALLNSACGGSGESPSGGTNPPPPPPPPPANVSITLASKNLDVNADAGQLYAYVGDAAITRRGMASVLNENSPALRLMPGVSSNSVTLSVPKGKTVTIIAVEFHTNGSNIAVGGPRTGGPVSNIAPRSEIEWVGWEGNPSQPEPGVAVISADADKTVTAVFDRVVGLMFRALGCSAIKLQTTNTVGLLSFGGVIADPPPDLTSTNGISQTGWLQPEIDQAFLYGKQGTIFTLRTLDIREDRSPGVLRSGFIRWDGSASICGTNLNCQVPLPSKANAGGALAMRLISGYSVTNGTVYGCNCNPLTPTIPCQMLP